MGYRKSTVQVTFNIDISVNDGVDVDEILNEMDYDFKTNTNEADVLDSEMTNFELIDAR